MRIANLLGIFIPEETDTVDGELFHKGKFNLGLLEVPARVPDILIKDINTEVIAVEAFFNKSNVREKLFTFLEIVKLEETNKSLPDTPQVFDVDGAFTILEGLKVQQGTGDVYIRYVLKYKVKGNECVPLHGVAYEKSARTLNSIKTPSFVHLRVSVTKKYDALGFRVEEVVEIFPQKDEKK